MFFTRLILIAGWTGFVFAQQPPQQQGNGSMVTTNTNITWITPSDGDVYSGGPINAQWTSDPPIDALSLSLCSSESCGNPLFINVSIENAIYSATVYLPEDSDDAVYAGLFLRMNTNTTSFFDSPEFTIGDDDHTDNDDAPNQRRDIPSPSPTIPAITTSIPISTPTPTPTPTPFSPSQIEQMLAQDIPIKQLNQEGYYNASMPEWLSVYLHATGSTSLVLPGATSTVTASSSSSTSSTSTSSSSSTSSTTEPTTNNYDIKDDSPPLPAIIIPSAIIGISLLFLVMACVFRRDPKEFVDPIDREDKLEQQQPPSLQASSAAVKKNGFFSKIFGRSEIKSLTRTTSNLSSLAEKGEIDTLPVLELENPYGLDYSSSSNVSNKNSASSSASTSYWNRSGSDCCPSMKSDHTVISFPYAAYNRAITTSTITPTKINPPRDLTSYPSERLITREHTFASTNDMINRYLMELNGGRIPTCVTPSQRSTSIPPLISSRPTRPVEMTRAVSDPSDYESRRVTFRNTPEYTFTPKLQRNYSVDSRCEGLATMIGMPVMRESGR